MSRSKRGAAPASKAIEKRRNRAQLTREELVFQPWFLPARIARTIRWLIPPDYRLRFHYYFDDYGCMRCKRKDVIYKSNGMCRGCVIDTFEKLQLSLSKRTQDHALKSLKNRYGHEFLANALRARKLLAEFSCYKLPAGSPTKSFPRHNPVSGAL
jgi:hypothetical protein